MEDRLDGPDLAAPAAMAPVVVEIGTSLAEGRYRLVEKLGEGGFGVAFKAVEEGTAVRRTVAVKILHGQLPAGGSEARARAAERFRAEVYLVANLNHPNIVHVYYDGMIGAQMYFVMEYLEGSRSLAKILREAQEANTFVPLTTVKDYFLQVAAGLRAIHRLPGVFHRDIKLDNLIVSDDADGSRVKIVDFGIAHNPDLPMTRTGSVLGTPQYLAPEMIGCDASGKALVLDHRVDLYALGAALYKFVTFHFPFDSAQASTSSFKPAPPSCLRPMPASLERIIMRLLEKDRDKRYPNAALLMADLLAFDPQEAPIQTEPKAQEDAANQGSVILTLSGLPSLEGFSGLLQKSGDIAAVRAISSGNVGLAALEGGAVGSDDDDLNEEDREYIRALHATRQEHANPAKRRFGKRLDRRDQLLLCGAVLLCAALSSVGVVQWRKSRNAAPATADLQVRQSPQERAAVSAHDILRDAQDSDRQFIERPGSAAKVAANPVSARSSSRRAKPQRHGAAPSAPAHVSNMATNVIPAVAATPVPSPALDDDPLARFQTTLLKRPTSEIAVVADAKTLGIPSATFATAVLDNALSSDHPETLVVARLSYGVTVGNRRLLSAGTKLVGRASYQERGGQWFVDIRFDRLVRSGDGAGERRIQAIATQHGQAGLRGTASKKDERDTANLGTVVLNGVKKALGEQPGGEVADPFMRDRVDDLRALRRGSVVVQLARGTVFQAQFTQSL